MQILKTKRRPTVGPGEREGTVRWERVLRLGRVCRFKCKNPVRLLRDRGRTVLSRIYYIRAVPLLQGESKRYNRTVQCRRSCEFSTLNMSHKVYPLMGSHTGDVHPYFIYHYYCRLHHEVYSSQYQTYTGGGFRKPLLRKTPCVHLAS